MILLTGATGQVGRRVAGHLAGRDDVLALARSDAAAAKIEALGLRAVRGDLSRPDTLAGAFDGVERLFLVTPFVPDQETLERNVLDAATDMRWVVKISTLNRGIAISTPHEAIEQRIEQAGIERTVLRADFFSTNLLAQLTAIEAGSLYYPAGAARRPILDPADLAEVAAAELTAGEPVGGVIPVTGPQALSFADVADRISSALGNPVSFVDVDASDWRAGLLDAGLPEYYADALVELFEADFKPTGTLEPADGVQRVLGRAATPIDRFLRDELAPAIARDRAA